MSNLNLKIIIIAKKKKKKKKPSFEKHRPHESR